MEFDCCVNDVIVAIEGVISELITENTMRRHIDLRKEDFASICEACLRYFG